MKNVLATSDTRDFVAPYAVASGAPFKVGGYIAVANTAAAQGATLTGDIRGAFTLPKATGAAWTKGDTLYWDDTNKVFTKTASGNSKAGLAFADAASGDATGGVDLVPTI